MPECLPITCGCPVDPWAYQAQPCACVVTTDSLPDGVCGEAYSATIEVEGVIGTFVITSGSLPPGLTLNAETGVVSGTPECA